MRRQLLVLLLASVAAPAAAGPAPCLPGFPHASSAPLAPAAQASYLDPAGAVRIVGYNDMAFLIGAWDQLFARRHRGVRFAPDLPATKAAPPALLAGRSALAPMGAEMAPADLAAFDAEPLAISVAHDSLDPRALSGPLGLIVSRGNPLRSLSLAQVAHIYAAGGGARTWGDLGLRGAWASRPIHRIGLKPDTALAAFLRARAFPQQSYDPAIQGFGHSTEVVAAVAADPDAVGFAAVNTVAGKAKVLALAGSPGSVAVAPTRAALRAGRYPLDRTLLIYARRPLDNLTRAYLDLALSCEGQAAVAADPLGYIPLTPAQAAAERRKLDRERAP